MLVTAKLVRDGKTVSDGILFKDTGHVYTVSKEHQDFLGPELVVVAGPHTDFSIIGQLDVYTVELLSPPSGPISANLPFFNSSGWWQHLTIRVD
jgi:hypothetical protein